MKLSRNLSLKQSIWIALGLAILTYSITLGGAFIDLLWKPIFLILCIICIPFVSGVYMAITPKKPRLLLILVPGLVPPMLLCSTGFLLFNSLPCPIHHRFEILIAFGSTCIVSLPVIAIGWWIGKIIRKKMRNRVKGSF